MKRDHTKYGLKLNKQILKIRQSEVLYVGHMLTREGLRADTAKAAAIRDMPKPDDKEIKRFLEIVTYCLGTFIQNLSEISAPIRIIL